MIRGGFLDEESRRDLTELARDGSAAHRLARRANALVLLDDNYKRTMLIGAKSNFALCILRKFVAGAHCAVLSK